jgi:hypothetical protein
MHRRLVAGFATAAFISGGLNVAGLVLGRGYRAGRPHVFAVDGSVTAVRPARGACHTYYIVPSGQGNTKMVDLQGNLLDSWIWIDSAPQVTPVPMAPPPPPPPVFCSPRGALIIIPPICDEIGIDLPPGSVRG